MTFHHDRLSHVLRQAEAKGLHETDDETQAALSRLTGKPARIAKELGLIPHKPDEEPQEDDVVSTVRKARRGY